MKKVFALALVAGVCVFASCKSEKKEEAAADSTSTMTETAAPETAVVDSAAAPADSAAADTAKKM